MSATVVSSLSRTMAPAGTRQLGWEWTRFSPAARSAVAWTIASLMIRLWSWVL